MEKLSRWLLVAGSGLFLLCVVYQAARLKHLSTAREVAVYYLLPVSAAVGLIACLRLKDTLRVNVSLALATSATMLLLLEGALTVFTPLDAEAGLVRAAAAAGVEVDERSREEVVAEMRARGVPAYSRVPARPLQLHVDGESVRAYSLGGISKVETVMDRESGRYIIYSSDDHGFNNPAGIWNSGSVPLAAVGDSFVLGYGVDPEANMLGLLRSQYPRTLNLGLAGNGPLLELAGIKEFLVEIEPRVVLWFFYEGNDLQNLARERTDEVLLRYFEERGFRFDVRACQKSIDRQLMQGHDRALASALADGRGDESRSMRGAAFALLTLTRLRFLVSVYRRGGAPEQGFLRSHILSGML